MNKKIFTLLAVSLMLFTTAFVVNAQEYWGGGTPVTNLPSGTGKNAYHLAVKIPATSSTPADTLFLAMDEYGYLRLRTFDAVNASYDSLRSALWCVNVVTHEVPGTAKWATFKFTNREHGVPLAVYDGGWKPQYTSYGGITWQIQQTYADQERVLVGGPLEEWSFGTMTYADKLEKEQYLRIQVGLDDEFLTFVWGGSDKDEYYTGSEAIKLAKVHGSVFDKNHSFYQDSVLRFTLIAAAPRVLKEKDINSHLYTQTEDGPATLKFEPSPTAGGSELEKPFTAEEGVFVLTTSPGSYYVKLKSSGKYIYVSSKEFYNDRGELYPKIETQTTLPGDSSGFFRFVYYPSEDSVVINAMKSWNEKAGSPWKDNGSYGLGGGLYNWTIYNNLIVRLQDVDDQNKRVLTVRDIPNNVRAHFGVSGCSVTDDRTSVPSDLYIIKDEQGRTLCVPLWAGDLTPRWIQLGPYENPLKMPSCHWLVVRSNENSDVSHVHLINREFENIRLEYLQLFTKLSEFHPVFNSAFYYKGGADYRPAFYDGAMLKGEVGTDKYFIRVTGEARKNPRWGYKYIEKDEINLTGYAFKYFGTTSFDDPNANLYLGVGETTNKSKADTSLYALTDKTFFALELPDELTGDGVEQYGIGRNNDFGTDTLVRRINRKYSDEQIAILERLYYKFKISDYFKYQWNDNYVVLEEHGATARYGYTQDAWAKSRQLQYAKFYLRNTYEKGGVDYYALLDRIIDSNFHHLTQITGLSLTDTLRASVEKSHTGITDKQDVQGFGVVKLGIDDYNWYAIGEVKSTNPRTSGFAIETLTEPLYRRFETLDEGSVEGDEPDTVMFYQARMDGLDGSRSYLYEDQHSGYSYNSNTYEPGTTQYGNGIRYLGAINNKLDESRIGQDPVHPHNFAMYVDTAYVNRGTGRIKPQYLLVVDPKKDIGYDGCPTCGDGAPAVPYVYGRYLRNMADSAWVTPPNGQIKYEKYMWKTKWNRLAFVNAIHAGDSLYILAERTIVSPDGTVTDPITQFCEKGGAYDGKLNFKKLQAEEGKKVAKIVNLANNRHKDEVFSFRFVERQYNPNGTVNTAASKEFYIESETTNRDTGKGRMIAPMEGGWIKIQDYVPIITRGAYHDVIIQAEVFDVEKTTKEPVANEAVATTDVKVVSGKGSVTILNATGENVIIRNSLGQTVANTVLTVDNATIAVPQGIVIVTVGGNTVKAIVK